MKCQAKELAEAMNMAGKDVIDSAGNMDPIINKTGVLVTGIDKRRSTHDRK